VFPVKQEERVKSAGFELLKIEINVLQIKGMQSAFGKETGTESIRMKFTKLCLETSAPESDKLIGKVGANES
jgi:hypothetical protein